MRAGIERWLQGVWAGTGLVSTLLLPFSWITGRIIARRAAALRRHPERAWRAPVPVIVVGNILVGGTGKTPIVIALAQAMQARGWQPGVVSRGYGVNVGEQARVSDEQPDASKLGDEPALIAQATGMPVAVHPQRARAIRALLHHAPEVDLIVSDDGLQHAAMARDLEIIVQDGRGTGNGRLLPAGPLRDFPERIGQVDWVVTTLAPNQPEAAHTPRELSVRHQPVRMQHLATGEHLAWADWRTRYGGTTCSAVAAIGQPDRFFAMLEAAGIDLAHTRALPDHDDFKGSPFRDLPQAPILITAKDAVKCGNLDDTRLWAVLIEPVFSDPAWFDQVDRRLRETWPDGPTRIKL